MCASLGACCVVDPVVAVIGGYSEFKLDKRKKPVLKDVPGPIAHIEIISPKKKCYIGMAPVNLGVKKYACEPVCLQKYPNGPPPGEQPCCNIVSEADVVGHTGQFSNGAPIYCGGRTHFDNSNQCYEYDYKTN